MSKLFPIKPLGQVLQQADLISSTQIELALQEQTQAKSMRLGDILVMRGWLKQETVDFFAEYWPTLLNQKSKQPLGYYLKKAGLLNQEQIRIILSEQRQLGMRFGELAVLRGWIKRTTIRFFLEHLSFEYHSPEYHLHQPSLEQETITLNDIHSQTELLNWDLVAQQENNLPSNHIHQSAFNPSSLSQKSAHLRPFIRSIIKLFNLTEKASCPDIVLEYVLYWTDGQPFLTQKLCQLLYESEAFIPVGEEEIRVQQLVQTRLVNHWETQVAAEHLWSIRDGLLKNQHCDPTSLLRLYQQILQEGKVPANDSPAQAQLLNLGLVVKQEGKLRVSNRIYQSVFNLDWVNHELIHLRPSIRSTIKLFKLEEKATHPDIVLDEVLSWTNGQPFLTQKICQLLYESEGFIAVGKEAIRVQQLIESRIINYWQSQVASEHLQAIRDGLLENQQCNPTWLLRLYQQILQEGEVTVNDSPVQAQLLSLGLIVKQGDKLRVFNRIYKSVFHLDWVNQELNLLQLLSQNTIKLFKLEEKASRPNIVLEEVLSWTDGQPLLTQKLCQLLCESEAFIAVGEEAIRVQQLVESRMINYWQTQIATEHLRAIRDGLIKNQHCDPTLLLRLYQEILQEGEVIANDDSPAQIELLNLGLVVKQEGKLRVHNRIYQSVFNLSWAERQLAKRLEPSALRTTFNASIQPVTAIASLTVRNWVSNPRGRIITGICVVLGIAGFSIVGLNIFKNLEVKSIFEDGNQLYHQREFKQAIAKYDSLLSIDSNYYQAWTNRGYALAGLQEYNKMLDSCTTATIIEPKANYAWNCQGEALHNLKQYNEAISAFDKAIALDSKNHIFWINKTESLLALKESDTALISINEALKLLQQTKEVHEQESIIRELSIAFSHKGKILSQKQQYEEALEAFNQALTYDPQYFTAQRGRGIALQALKRYDGAIAQFQVMLSESQLTDAQKAETLYYLGLTYCNSSKTKEGIAALESAVKLKPDFQAAEEAKLNCGVGSGE